MNAKKILSRRYNDNTTHLFKQFLRIVEELKRDHDDSYKKLREQQIFVILLRKIL